MKKTENHQYIQQAQQELNVQLRSLASIATMMRMQRMMRMM